MANLEKKRSEIKIEDQWDLSTIYSDEELWEEDYKKVKQEIDSFSKKYEEHFMDNASTFLETIEADLQMDRVIEKLYMYAHLKHDEDTTNSKYQTLVGRMEQLSQEYRKVIAFIIPTILKYEYSVIEQFYEDEPRLKEYTYYLKDIYRFKEHTLDKEKTEMMALMSKVFGNAEGIYESLTYSDMKFGTFLDENGEKIELSDHNYGKYIESSDRRVRKDVFTLMYQAYAGLKNTISSTLRGDVNTNIALSRVYHYPSAIEQSLFGDEVDLSVYQNLIDTVHQNFKPLFDYYAMKKDILGLDELHLYDIYTPLIQNENSHYEFLEAKNMVISALQVLGEDYISHIKQAFDERWIDIYSNVGKRSGAYSSGGYDTNPFLLLNYQGTLNDVSTLAHELGHSMHSYYSCKNNPYHYSGYRIFVAEVASTVNELLLAYYLLDHTDDKNEKLTILNRLLELFKSTIYRQTMFAEFERDIYSMAENGEILTHELLCSTYYDLVKQYFGDDVVVDSLIQYEWEIIPHFYYNFYVYKYATGLSAACYIVDGILNKREGALENYLKFLTLGGSMSPLEELKVAGVDMNDPKVIESAIRMFEKTIEDFKTLYYS